MKGKVPAHQSLLVLYTKTPTKFWPSDIGSASSLYQNALLYQKEFQGKVLLCRSSSNGFRETCSSLNFTDADSPQVHKATFFAKMANPFYINALASGNLGDWAKELRERTQDGIDVVNMLEGPGQARSLIRSSYKSLEYDKKRKLVKKIWVMVCTHGSRDCRCGEHGTAVYGAFIKEISSRKLWHRFNVCEVSHVGGHAYAANVLVYPYGDWYGTMRPEDIPSFIDSIDGIEGGESLSGPQSPLWRGSWFDQPGEPVSEGDQGLRA
ncbi:hypothetical protein FRC15_002945 [Serendipita sp. 397]|nr:hypothetical protein FRC15_002945 [Serendipita sp. 397]